MHLKIKKEPNILCAVRTHVVIDQKKGQFPLPGVETFLTLRPHLGTSTPPFPEGNWPVLWARNFRATRPSPALSVLGQSCTFLKTYHLQTQHAMHLQRPFDLYNFAWPHHYVTVTHNIYPICLLTPSIWTQHRPPSASRCMLVWQIELFLWHQVRNYASDALSAHGSDFIAAYLETYSGLPYKPWRN